MTVTSGIACIQLPSPICGKSVGWAEAQRSPAVWLRASAAEGSGALLSWVPPCGAGDFLCTRKESYQRNAPPDCAVSQEAASRCPALLGRVGLHRHGIPAVTMKASAPASPRCAGKNPPRPAVLGAVRRGLEKQKITATAQSGAMRRLAFFVSAFDVRAPLGALSIAARAGDVRAWMPAKHRHGRKPCRCGSPSTREAQGTVQSTARTRGVLSLGYFSLHEQREVCPPNRGGMKNLRTPVMQRGEALDHSVHRGSPMASVGLRFAPAQSTAAFSKQSPQLKLAMNGGLRRSATNPPYDLRSVGL